MKKRLLSLMIALALCLGLLPVTASAAQSDLPDWYFLFAIFKNVDADVKDGNQNRTHQKYTMPQDEIDGIRDDAQEFEEYMNSLGIMRAHVDVAEIDAPVTELYHPDNDSSCFRMEQAAPLLESKVDLDRYDHVTCILNLNVWTGWAGLTLSEFENGTGIANINFQNGEHYFNSFRTSEKDWILQLYVHEFLHFMERMSSKWGSTFVLHRDGKTHYIRNDNWKKYYTDAILNQVDELDVFPEGGTGVHSAAWQYPPSVLRTMTELTIPSGVTTIGDSAFLRSAALTRLTIPAGVTNIGVWAFQDCTALSSVTVPSSVTAIGNAAFERCTALTEFTIPSGVASLGEWAFQGCIALTQISIPASVTNIGAVAFYNTGVKDVYYGGTEAQWKAVEIGDYNEALAQANVHCNSLMSDVKTTDWFARGVAWAIENGVTAGTGEYCFSPDSSCTQAQILTFLWRAYGSPEPLGRVTGSEYYAIPIQWAEEQGIVNTGISPNALCTRADTVTYLWKLAGSPKAGAVSFTDVPADAGYAKAVNWAVEKGVTSGTGGGAFGPDSTCTRGQIVTFLYSALGK